MNAPYDYNRITRDVYGYKLPVAGNVVALLHVSFSDRGLRLIETKSRVVKKGEIHELMITDEKAVPGGGADRVRALAFFEIEKPGLIVVGDLVKIGEIEIGFLAGYDETHMPNHMNIVVIAPSLDEPIIHVNDTVNFSSS